MDLHLGNLSRLSSSASRSISAENPSGGIGGGGRAVEGRGRTAARELGTGWKVSPAVTIEPGELRVIADIGGPGAIQHVWMGVDGDPRLAVVRVAWDGSGCPSVECPVGHFFACGWGGVEPVSSLAVCMNPRNGLNCWWEMPFRTSCRLSVENVGPETIALYYQIDYTLADVPQDAGHFHARFSRSGAQVDGGSHAILEEVRGRGQYVGTYLAWQSGTAIGGGDRQVEFRIDGDCGEVRRSSLGSYFGWAEPRPHGSATIGFHEFSTPYGGRARATGPAGEPSPFLRLGLYRWHIMDPIRFSTSLRVVACSPDSEPDGYGGPKGEELASVAYWYQQP